MLLLAIYWLTMQSIRVHNLLCACALPGSIEFTVNPFLTISNYKKYCRL
jgi:hypothetical protein